LYVIHWIAIILAVVAGLLAFGASLLVGNIELKLIFLAPIQTIFLTFMPVIVLISLYYKERITQYPLMVFSVIEALFGFILFFPIAVFGLVISVVIHDYHQGYLGSAFWVLQDWALPLISAGGILAFLSTLSKFNEIPLKLVRHPKFWRNLWFILVVLAALWGIATSRLVLSILDVINRGIRTDYSGSVPRSFANCMLQLSLLALFSFGFVANKPYGNITVLLILFPTLAAASMGVEIIGLFLEFFSFFMPMLIINMIISSIYFILLSILIIISVGLGRNGIYFRVTQGGEELESMEG